MTTVKIVKMGINGEGIAYIDHKPVFVEGAFPEETVDIEITFETDRYAKARTLSIKGSSKDRRKPTCMYTDTCGACALAAMYPKAQQYYKKQLLEEALYKYGNIRREIVRDVHTNGIEEGYRTQCKMPVQMSHGKLTTGLYTAGTNHFHPFDTCIIQDPELEAARTAVLRVLNTANMQAYDQNTKKGIRYLVLRTLHGKTQCTLITGIDTIPSAVINGIMKIKGMTSLFQSVNIERKGVDIFGRRIQKLAGEDTIDVKLNGITLSLSPRSFFQLNAEEAIDLYEMAIAKIDPCGTLVEAYCGVGAMSLLASTKAEHIIGIESIPEAVENANANAAKNGIENAKFICADAAEGLADILLEEHVDTLLADPPRSGMDDAMIDTILSSNIRKIIYVSCNPATLARNLKDLKREYQVVTIIPFDLFPNTPHIEAIAVLQRNGTFDKRKSRRRKYGKKKSKK